MKKLLLLLLIASPCLADGPIYRHKEPEKQLEFENVYQDLRSVRSSTSQVNTLLKTTSTWTATQNFKAITATTIQTPYFNVGTTSITATEPMINTGQPAFLVTFDNIGATDVTGDGTDYTVAWAVEVYDQGSNFASNTFTAPVTGRYILTATVMEEHLLVTHTVRYAYISTSNRNYIWENDGAVAANDQSFSVSAVADMDAGDTATVHAVVNGGTKTVDIPNGGTLTFFSGTLAN